MTAAKQKGFTLVEIAIVLVIIGLLLGGVFQVQTLAQNAKIKAAASDVNGYQVAIYSYQDRFGDLFDQRNHFSVGVADMMPFAYDPVPAANGDRMVNELVARDLVGSRGIAAGIQQHALSGDIKLYKRGAITDPRQGTHLEIARNDLANPVQFNWTLCYNGIRNDDDARALIQAIDGARTTFPAAYNTGNARLVDAILETQTTFAASTADTICFNLQ